MPIGHGWGMAESAAKLCQRAQTFATTPAWHYQALCLQHSALAFRPGMIFSENR
jgi:hypothetical protein